MEKVIEDYVDSWGNHFRSVLTDDGEVYEEVTYPDGSFTVKMVQQNEQDYGY